MGGVDLRFLKAWHLCAFCNVRNAATAALAAWFALSDDATWLVRVLFGAIACMRGALVARRMWSALAERRIPVEDNQVSADLITAAMAFSIVSMYQNPSFLYFYALQSTGILVRYVVTMVKCDPTCCTHEFADAVARIEQGTFVLYI